MPFLELNNLTCRFGDQTALLHFSLCLEQGEIMSLLGPSGCGKTTTLRLIAGFLSPLEGKILVQGRDITPLPPEQRHMGMVFQSYALFPHLNVFENVAFGLRATRLSSRQIPERVRKTLDQVHLSGYENRPIFQLSGGEQQRVAIARALVIEPQILLLDEPLSNLDASLRERTRKQLRELISSLKMTTLFVTHDQEDAFALSDRIALLCKGTCQQIGAARELYDHPVNEFVAGFIGKSNILALRLQGIHDNFLDFELPRGEKLCLPARQGRPFEVGQVYRLLLRPERIDFFKSDQNTPLFPAKIKSGRFAGAYYEWELEGEGQQILAIAKNPLNPVPLTTGSIVTLYASPLALHVLEA
jgi:ABC-type Fe3+/spermidine/putrescine transport system ATPase subunit